MGAYTEPERFIGFSVQWVWEFDAFEALRSTREALERFLAMEIAFETKANRYKLK